MTDKCKRHGRKSVTSLLSIVNFQLQTNAKGTAGKVLQIRLGFEGQLYYQLSIVDYRQMQKVLQKLGYFML